MPHRRRRHGRASTGAAAPLSRAAAARPGNLCPGPPHSTPKLGRQPQGHRGAYDPRSPLFQGRTKLSLHQAQQLVHLRKRGNHPLWLQSRLEGQETGPELANGRARAPR